MLLQILMLLLGSGLTILGAFLANHHNFNLSQKTEQSRLMRERLDQLAQLVCSIDDWIEQTEEDTMADPPRRTPSEPMDRIYLYTTIYFPSLWNDMHPLCDSSRRICQLIRNEASRRLQEGTIDQKYVDARTELWKPFLLSKDAAIESIGKFAKTIKY